MNPTLKDHALCLACRLYSESSQIATLFTRHTGKIQIIAKGSRKQKSRFAGGLDPLTEGSVLFTLPTSQTSLATLIEFDLQEGFLPLRKQLPTLYAGQYLCQLLQTFLEQQDPHEKLYDQTLQSLHNLQTNVPVLETIVNFELQLLQEIGLTPQWDRCSSCGQPLQQNHPTLYFSSHLGGMICRDCEPAVTEKRLVTKTTWQHLKATHPKQPPAIATAPAAHDILYYHLREQAGKELSLEKLLRQSLAASRKKDQK